MKKLPLVLLLVPAIALATKSYNEGNGEAWDCGKDPKVAINTNNSTYTFTGACELIVDNGNNNTLEIESVKLLTVNGNKGAAKVGTLGSSTINGNDNKLTWKKAAAGAKPSVRINGRNNTAAQEKPEKK